MLAKKSLAYQKQLVHREFTKAKIEDREINLDFSNTNKIGNRTLNNELSIKVRSNSQ